MVEVEVEVLRRVCVVAFVCELSFGGNINAIAKATRLLSSCPLTLGSRWQGHGKRNYSEKFASTVFTHVYEEDVRKGPCAPINPVAKANTQLSNKVDKMEALRGRIF